MPSAHNKPTSCSDRDCIDAFKNFLKEIKDALEVDDKGCWIASKPFKGRTGNQFKIPYKDDDGKTKYFRVKLYRMWFYSKVRTIAMAEDHTKYTCSHLCHNNGCLNPQHLVLEDLATNKARNVCPGTTHCTHTPKCLALGPQYDADRTVAFWEDNKLVIKRL